jgi:tetratricopeptide (TPR) repeat protein
MAMYILRLMVIGLVLVGISHAADKPVTAVYPATKPKVTTTNTYTATPRVYPTAIAKPATTNTLTAAPKAYPTATARVTPVSTPKVTPAPIATPAAPVKATPTVKPTAATKATPAPTPPTTPKAPSVPAPTVAPAASVTTVAAQSKKPPVIELIKPATELMSQAQEAYIGADSKKAVALFREALVLLVKLERDYPQWAPTPTFSPVRFRKAICETEIERVLLEEAQASSRTIAVTDTRELEKMRQDRKNAAETNRVVVTTRKLNSKSSGEVVDEVAVKEDATKPVVKPAEPKGPVKISEELEWAKDMIQVEQFANAETALIKVLKADAENKEARFLMALAKVQQGKASDALIMLDDALEDTPGDEATLLLAAGAQFSQGAYSKAMELLDTAMKANPRRPDAYLNMAWLLLDMRPDALTDAELYYRQAVKLGLARNRDMERRLGIKQ